MKIEFEAEEEIICPPFTDPVADCDSHQLITDGIHWMAMVQHRNGDLRSGEYGILVVAKNEVGERVFIGRGNYIYPREVPGTGERLAQDVTNLICRNEWLVQGRIRRGETVDEHGYVQFGRPIGGDTGPYGQTYRRKRFFEDGYDRNVDSPRRWGGGSRAPYEGEGSGTYGFGKPKPSPGYGSGYGGYGGSSYGSGYGRYSYRSVPKKKDALSGGLDAIAEEDARTAGVQDEEGDDA